MSNPGTVIVLILTVGVLFVLLPLAAHTFARYRPTRALRCPETGEPVRLDVDASRAALTSAFGQPRLRVKWCTLWPGRGRCGQSCLRHLDVAPPQGLETGGAGP